MLREPAIRKQRGAALLVFFVLIVLGAATLLVNRLNRLPAGSLRDQRTAQALAEAKAALAGWAAGHPVRPGLMPLPDRNGDGDYDGNSDCAGLALPADLTGRLPWLGYPAPCVDPQSGPGVRWLDGDNEPLWYAVSANLIYNGGYPSIDSDLRNVAANWLSVWDETGALVSNRVAALVIAPGASLTGQDRAGAAPAVGNYLEGVDVGGVIYSNADLDLDFIAAPVSDTFNDRLLYLTVDELIPLVERRVVRVAKCCLRDYAAASAGKYPWAAQLDGSAAPEFGGDFNVTFGRISDTPNIDTAAGGAGTDGAMQPAWPAGCFTALPYWTEWKESLFYQVAPGYQPGSAPGCPTCLTLDGGGSYHAVVMTAGHALAALAQQRVTDADKGNPANYLEGDNATVGDNAYVTGADSGTFNDQPFCLDGDATCQ